MDDPLRARLYSAVVACRRVLEDDLLLRLEGQFDIVGQSRVATRPPHEPADDAGDAPPPDARAAGRAAIEATLAHYNEADRAAAVARFVRESAFTWLNRLAALKLMEHPQRAIIRPTIGDGPSSRGFLEFARVSPAAMRAEADGGYLLYLALLADDLAPELGALFDRRPTSLLVPGRPALAEVLDRLNDPELAPAWAEDETLGWVYQYFTPTEQRRQARQESAAPRDAHELSFRNQFYTPRYVVAFLAENTLGRLWVARRGVTRRGDRSRLVDACRYLLRPDTEQDPDVAEPGAPPLDPRAIRVLDPACGSGHFLLYCFDLLEMIYAEAYGDEASGDEASALRADYPDPVAFARAVPGLILAHNLHGIDIDPRAAQIARLALWLRAQRSYRALGLAARRRPRTPAPGIVLAAPVPGEANQLAAFARDAQPAALGRLLPGFHDALRGVDELGPLLKIEQTTARLVAAARAQAARPQQPLFDAPTPPGDPFWDDALGRLQAALSDYARAGHAQQGHAAAARRLFAEDAAEGAALLALLHQPFDVVLMNPPFGAPTPTAKPYLDRHYPRSKHDLYAAFVERGLELLRPGGYLGAITSRTGFFLSSFQKWREEVLLQSADLVALADLGYGVLDTAMVETAAYVLRRKKEE